MRAQTRRIELFYDRGHHHEFLSLSQELAAPGEMRQAQTYEFNFKNVEKQFESYQGINVKLRLVFTWSMYSRFSFNSSSRLQVLRAGVNLASYGRCSEREGHLGPFLPHASRIQ
jgi:Vacuolar protein sorting-associated protein 26